jgi:hypothetical protein
MVHRCRRFAVAALAATLLLGGCEKSAPPPPPPVKVEPPAPPVNAELKRLASEVYLFAYPLVLMNVTMGVATASTPLNTFAHERSLPGPQTRGVDEPNGDVLFSRAWLDVSAEPLVLSIPDFKDRYYLVALIDGWTNVFSSIGTRTIGEGKQDYAIVGPGWKGKLPADVSEIRAPTGMVWAVGRIEVSGEGDYAAVHKLQDQLDLTPLSRWHKPAPKAKSKPKTKSKSSAPEPAPAPAPAPDLDVKTAPTEQVARMDPVTFFTRFAALLPANPPRKDDAPMAEKIAKFGIVGGQPYAIDKLDAPSKRAVEEGVKSVYAAMLASARGSLGDLRNGWTIHADTGRYGTDYGARAVMALVGLGANAPEDAVFATTYLDGAGKPLQGSSRYVLHFDKGATPPTHAFWSLSMYDKAHAPVANAIDRYRIGDRDKLQSNPDGSLDILLASEDPGKAKQSNWLPAPKGEFELALRIYWPKQEVLERRWAPPAVRPEKP